MKIHSPSWEGRDPLGLGEGSELTGCRWAGGTAQAVLGDTWPQVWWGQGGCSLLTLGWFCVLKAAVSRCGNGPGWIHWKGEGCVGSAGNSELRIPEANLPRQKIPESFLCPAFSVSCRNSFTFPSEALPAPSQCWGSVGLGIPALPKAALCEQSIHPLAQN